MSLYLKKKDVKENFTVFKFSYCSIQNLVEGSPRATTWRIIKLGYSCGVYGWDCDYYLVLSKSLKYIVCTGYRPTCNEELTKDEYKQIYNLNEKLNKLKYYDVKQWEEAQSEFIKILDDHIYNKY